MFRIYIPRCSSSDCDAEKIPRVVNEINPFPSEFVVVPQVAGFRNTEY